MRCWIALLLTLSSCFNATSFSLVQGPSVQKQRQKIALLQRKKEIAQKEKTKVEQEVEDLSSEIDRLQLALIQRKLAEYECQEKKSYSPFLEERESLYKIMESGPSPSAFEAQVELDRILRIITEFSETEPCLY